MDVVETFEEHLKKQTVFVISCLVVSSGNYFDRHSERYYKIYDTKSKKSAVITEDELVKKKDLIFNVYKYTKVHRKVDNYCRGTIYISNSVYDKDLLLHNFSYNKRSNMSDMPEYLVKEKQVSKLYTIVERGEDYVIGVNNREQRKVFSIADIMTMTSDEVDEQFNMAYCNTAVYTFDYEEEVRDYLAKLPNKGDYKFKDNKEIKKNQSRITVGANYVVRSNGDIVINKKDQIVSIKINNHNYPNLNLLGDRDMLRHVRHFSVLSGPTRLKKIQELGGALPEVEVVLPSTLEKIETQALCDSHITKIDLERCKNLRVIGSGAFRNTYLKGLKLPDNVTQVGSSVAMNCVRLEWFISPRYFRTFNPSWVEGCESLKTIVLPETEMEGWKEDKKTSFSRCVNLKEIYTSEENLDIANEMAQYILDLRKFMIKRKIWAYHSIQVSEEPVRVFIVKYKGKEKLE